MKTRIITIKETGQVISECAVNEKSAITKLDKRVSFIRNKINSIACGMFGMSHSDTANRQRSQAQIDDLTGELEALTIEVEF